MENKNYIFKGRYSRCHDFVFFSYLLELHPDNKYVVKEKIKSILSDDEKVEMELPNLLTDLTSLFTVSYVASIPHLRWKNSYSNRIYINLKASTIALLALLFDINVTNGIVNFVLAATGVNLRLIDKLDEAEGEKCVLLEVYRKEDHQADPDIFKHVCGKECINNDMNCKYRRNGVCTMDQERVKEIFESLYAKNVFTKRNDYYKYNFDIK